MRPACIYLFRIGALKCRSGAGVLDDSLGSKTGSRCQDAVPHLEGPESSSLCCLSLLWPPGSSGGLPQLIKNFESASCWMVLKSIKKCSSSLSFALLRSSSYAHGQARFAAPLGAQSCCLPKIPTPSSTLVCFLICSTLTLRLKQLK